MADANPRDKTFTRCAGEKVACKVGKIWDRDKASDVGTSFSRVGLVSLRLKRADEKRKTRMEVEFSDEISWRITRT